MHPRASYAFAYFVRCVLVDLQGPRIDILWGVYLDEFIALGALYITAKLPISTGDRNYLTEISTLITPHLTSYSQAKKYDQLSNYNCLRVVEISNIYLVSHEF